MHEMTFDEISKECVELELNAVVQGMPLAQRVKQVALVVAQWRHEKTISEVRARLAEGKSI